MLLTKEIWIPMDQIKDQQPIWAGTRIRMAEISPNMPMPSMEQTEPMERTERTKETEHHTVQHTEQHTEQHTGQYTEYLLSYIYGHSDALQLTCLTQGEAGNIGGVIPKDLPNHYALAQTLKTWLTGVYSEVLFE